MATNGFCARPKFKETPSTETLIKSTMGIEGSELHWILAYEDGFGYLVYTKARAEQ